LSGMVRPSVFAVIRLMTNSNFVGCCTGMSAVIRIEQHDQVLCDVRSIRHEVIRRGSFQVRRN
jgi:hypothetical protein